MEGGLQDLTRLDEAISRSAKGSLCQKQMLLVSCPLFGRLEAWLDTIRAFLLCFVLCSHESCIGKVFFAKYMIFVYIILYNYIYIHVYNTSCATWCDDLGPHAFPMGCAGASKVTNKLDR
jgi:hypothetical protein